MKPALATGPVFLWAQLTRIRAKAPPPKRQDLGGNDLGGNDLGRNDLLGYGSAQQHAKPSRHTSPSITL
jgi:hypothetical protein